jgi:hypothetical protein
VSRVNEGSRPPAGDPIERLRRLAWLLDSSIRIPGTGLTVGLDALIGLVPGIGDLVGVALSSWILKEAHALGVSKAVLARMTLNVLIEGAVGAVPFAGDLFDAAFKANQRNVKLLTDWMAQPKKEARAGWLFLAGMLAAIVGVLALAIVLAWLLLRALVGG